MTAPAMAKTPWTYEEWTSLLPSSMKMPMPANEHPVILEWCGKALDLGAKVTVVRRNLDTNEEWTVPGVVVAAADWREYLRSLGLPEKMKYCARGNNAGLAKYYHIATD